MPETQLRNEDQLRLNVLATQCSAIRIVESEMSVLGLADDGERRLRLSPTGSPERYLRAVRELLSSIAIHSPGGFPVFLSRWTRMGQLDSDRLAALLKLGEPEAVIAVASSPSIDANLARRAWWAHPVTETARFLLEHDVVRRSALAGELVAHVLEYLPFEQSPGSIANDVRLSLQPGLLGAEDTAALWRRGQRRSSILLGFLQACPAALPGHQDNDARFPDQPKALIDSLAGAPGRCFFDTVARVLERPGDQDIVVGALEVLADTLRPLRPPGAACRSIVEVDDRVRRVVAGTDPRPGRQAAPGHLLFLALVGEPLVREFFSRSSAVGPLMRRQLEPILGPVLARLRIGAG